MNTTASSTQLVQAIHDSPYQTVMAVAGAGITALAELLGVAGASRTLLEAIVPYSQPSFDQFLGRTPDQYVAAETARWLAGRALTRAGWLRANNEPVIGLACTATIATDRLKRGQHRAYVATWQAEQLLAYDLHIEKGIRDRAGEERLVAQLVLNALSQACGLAMQLHLPLEAGDRLETQTVDYAQAAQQLRDEKIAYFGVDDQGTLHVERNPPRAILSGAFNPVHQGHLQLVDTAAAFLNKPVAFELAAINVDKPPLPPEVILNRMAQFAGGTPVYISNARTYVQKAQIYPNATFVVGYDTAVRILDARYYDESQNDLDLALSRIREQGCRFLVAGRVDQSGTFHTLAELNVPEAFADCFQALPDELFRMDISSTQIREARRGDRE